MLRTTSPRTAIAIYRSYCRDVPLRAIAYTAVFCLAVQMGIDVWLGATAEFFNAWNVVLAACALLFGASADGLAFIYGQDELGRWAVPVALVVMLVQPLVYGTLIVGLAASRLCDPVKSSGNMS